MDSCQLLHQLFNRLKIFNFSFKEDEIPLNGIYILFEKGEIAHNTNRIVRVGTHTGNNQLRSRLKQHFLNENKDRSIFRKNIGRCLLNKESDPFLGQWELDLTSKELKEKYAKSINYDRRKEMERRVSEYIQRNFSFSVFRMNDKEKRLLLESKIVSTISLCDKCAPSLNWLGLYSPKERIIESGLWQVNELYKLPLSDNEMTELRRIIDLKNH
ncbi:MAG: hypothetical protein M1371_05880 [Actinobacteria bacterium]|nr:hypothetical protein [Actinomycetota bacterium]